MLYTNIYELLADILSSGQKDIICDDLPKQLIIGWKSESTEQSWQIRIRDYRLSRELDEQGFVILKELIHSFDKRNNIVEMLESIPIVVKLSKMKAFW